MKKIRKNKAKARKRRRLLAIHAIAFIVIALLFLFMFFNPFAPHLGKGNLNKRFFEATQSGGWKPLKDLPVELYFENGTFIASGVTDNTGRVVFCPLKNGTYILKFTYEGVVYEEEVYVEGQADIDNYLTPKSCGL